MKHADERAAQADQRAKAAEAALASAHADTERSDARVAAERARADAAVAEMEATLEAHRELSAKAAEALTAEVTRLREEKHAVEVRAAGTVWRSACARAALLAAQTAAASDAPVCSRMRGCHAVLCCYAAACLLASLLPCLLAAAAGRLPRLVACPRRPRPRALLRPQVLAS